MGWQDRDYHREESMQPPGRMWAGQSVTMWLLIINSAVFILNMILTGSARANAFSLMYWGNFNIPQAVHGWQLWRWVTYQFLHGDIFHILFNMLALYSFGRWVEQWWGARRFLAFYLLCGVSGAVIYTVMIQLGVLPSWMGMYLIGASGSIFGILIAAMVVAPNMRVMLMFPPIPMQLRTMVMVFLGIAVLSIVVGSTNAGGEAAHLGGAALGFVLVKFPWLLNWTGRIQGVDVRRKARQWQQERETRKIDDEEKEVDRILAKVKEQGLHSLSEREKRTLRQATDRQRDAG